jgi:serine/threonine protein kinase
MKAPATLGARNLSSLITKLTGRGKRLPKSSANAILYQLTRAVAHANRLGACHRDVCPANIIVETSSCMTQLTGWDHLSVSSSLYSAPEVIVSEELVILEHKTADVWSLGMVFIEALRGSPLVKMGPQKPLEPYLVLRDLFKSIGTPSEVALKALGCSSGSNPRHKVIQRRPWKTLLGDSRVDPDCTELLDRMLDWNPATREPAVSLLSSPYFATSRAESCKYKAVTQCELTTAEINGLISVAFAANASRLRAESEAATWMSSSSPQPPCLSPQSDSHAVKACGVHVQRPRRRSISERRGSATNSRLVTVHEDTLGEAAWITVGTPPTLDSESGAARP